MKLLAIILNVSLLLVVTGALLINGVGSDVSAWAWLLLSLAYAAPITSLGCLLTSGESGLVSLYFQRKALEEQKKINELRK
jgi:hypothetical protein